LTEPVLTNTQYCCILTVVMTMTAAITSNWQLHVPLAARKMAGFDRPGLVNITVKAGEITVKPKKSKLLSLVGSLHEDYLRNPINVDRVRDIIDYSQV